MAPLIPIIGTVALVSTGVAVKKFSTKRKEISKERKKIFEDSLRSLKDPVKLRQLAKVYRKEGCTHEAAELEKRAKVYEAAPKLQAQRKKAFKAALKNKDPKKVKAVADAFNKEGYYEAAATLRKYQRHLSNVSLTGGGKKQSKVSGEPDFECAEDPDMYFSAEETDEFSFAPMPEDGAEFDTGESIDDQSDDVDEIRSDAKNTLEQEVADDQAETDTLKEFAKSANNEFAPDSIVLPNESQTEG